MNKKFITRLFIVLVIASIFSMCITTNKVSARTIGEEKITEEENVVVEDKIMKLDAKTNEKTEVNMEEIKQKYEELEISGEANDLLKAYIPEGVEVAQPRATNSYREIVSDTSKFPYNIICKIVKYSADGLKGGSGILIGRNLLLTAAHCVFDEKNGDEIFRNWVAFPGYNNGPITASSGWASVYYSEAWLSTHDSSYDWALCVLEKNLADDIGYVAPAQAYGTEAELVGLSVRAARIS